MTPPREGPGREEIAQVIHDVVCTDLHPAEFAKQSPRSIDRACADAILAIYAPVLREREALMDAISRRHADTSLDGIPLTPDGWEVLCRQFYADVGALLADRNDCWEPGHTEDVLMSDGSTTTRRLPRVHCPACTDAAMARAHATGFAAGIQAAQRYRELIVALGYLWTRDSDAATEEELSKVMGAPAHTYSDTVREASVRKILAAALRHLTPGAKETR